VLPLAVVCGIGLENQVLDLGLGATGFVHITATWLIDNLVVIFGVDAIATGS